MKQGRVNVPTQFDSRMAWLDGLRGCAAISVVVFHYLSRFFRVQEEVLDPYSAIFAEYGKFGVHLFFIISGYVILLSAFRLVDFKSGVRVFIISRFFRLYPSFLACMIITTAVLILIGFPEREVHPKMFFMNLTMLPGLLGARAIDGVYWTLEKELIFYFFIALIILFQVKVKDFKFIFFSWTACAIVTSVIKLGCNIDTPITDAFVRLLLLDWVGFFAVGVFLCMYDRNFIDRSTAMFGITIASASAVLWHFEDLFPVATVIAIFILCCSYKFSVLTLPPVVFLGTISYPLYLIHQNVGYVTLLQLSTKFEISYYLSLAITFVLVISASLFIRAYVEAPMIKIGKKIR
jgi:peptidoglycan/LPS O-acetylase OafA/YrhL